MFNAKFSEDQVRIVVRYLQAIIRGAGNTAMRFVYSEELLKNCGVNILSFEFADQVIANMGELGEFDICYHTTDRHSYNPKDYYFWITKIKLPEGIRIGPSEGEW